MTSGGKRVRSGPVKDPNSEKSRKLGYTLQNLPNTECKARAPKWPLSPSEDEGVQLLEAAKWKWLWKLPQARAWHLPQFRWMVPELATYVRLSVACEIKPSPAAMTVLLRLSDRIGMSVAGLQALGWKIESDDMAKPVDSEFTRRRAEELRQEARADRTIDDDGTRHVYRRRMRGDG
ncbi:hypothetical protein [Bifidobacterium scardovii]|jgi:hypothetical protein|uniref:hypothetical protein n=1 Tax=Bifidobacterium scardovii TaxID=158787 RepID=UPI000B228CF9|nr:hypothetical protein [Bifidobacterium scardovii]DAO75367.1 MAG TPA: hypothetical protein [Caudoviricetes sp.]